MGLVTGPEKGQTPAATRCGKGELSPCGQGSLIRPLIGDSRLRCANNNNTEIEGGGAGKEDRVLNSLPALRPLMGSTRSFDCEQPPHVGGSFERVTSPVECPDCRANERGLRYFVANAIVRAPAPARRPPNRHRPHRGTVRRASFQQEDPADISALSHILVTIVDPLERIGPGDHAVEIQEAVAVETQ
jgi:hypothetical protein